MQRLFQVFLCFLLLPGCSENVGALSIDLIVPRWSPELVCEHDPRRIATVTATIACEGNTLTKTVTTAHESLTLPEVPLGDCTLEVTANNIHDRAVLSGASSFTLERGDNDPYKLQLVEERCDDPSCDRDGDRLGDSDESGLGTDPASIDTDGDGLEDGLEVLQCCTDPTRPDGECRELFIQRVEPPLGTIQSAVMIKASAALDRHQVLVGGRPLENLLADSTIAFGTVAPGAALGEVSLVANAGASGTPAPAVSYEELFAVLSEPPESVTASSQKATGEAPVIYQLVDQTFGGERHFLLGRSFAKDAASGTNSLSGVVPVLLVIDRTTSTAAKVQVSDRGDPVAVTARSDRALVLLEVDGQADIWLYDQPPGGIGLQGIRLAFDATVSGPLTGPVDLILEPSGNVALLLLADRLVRFRGTNGALETRVKTLTTLTAGNPSLPGSSDAGPLSCVGMAHRVATSGASDAPEAVYVACNMMIPCPPGKTCEAQGLVIQVPVKGCLDFTNVPPSGSTDPNNTLCRPLFHLAKARGPVFGNPVLDEKRRGLYQLTAAGVATMPLSGTPQGLSTLIPWKSEPSPSADLMALNGPFLFVVDGSRVYRTDPGHSSVENRLGKPFSVGRGAEIAQFLTVDPRAKSLIVATQVQGGFSALLRVCLEPCGP